MRLVFFGTAEFAVPPLRRLLAAGHTVLAAISQPDRPAGRGRLLRPTAVRAAAEELGIPHVQTEDVNSPDLRERFGQAQIGVVVAFGQKIGPAVLDGLPLGCVNIHGSLLPKYRGAAPVQWAILNGDEKTGVTIFQLDEHWDSGPIWAQRGTSIGETETADELHDRLAEIGAELIVETLPLIESGQTQPRSQDPAAASHARKLTREDGVVDWSQPASRIVRWIHGLWSWPAATCTFVSYSSKRERIQLARARVRHRASMPTDRRPPGCFCEDGTVQAGLGRVELLEVKPAGGKLMSFQAFACGRRIRPTDRLLPPDAS